LAQLILHDVDAADRQAEGAGTRLATLELDMCPAVGKIRVLAVGAPEELCRTTHGVDVEAGRTSTAIGAGLHVELELPALLAPSAAHRPPARGVPSGRRFPPPAQGGPGPGRVPLPGDARVKDPGLALTDLAGHGNARQREDNRA